MYVNFFRVTRYCDEDWIFRGALLFCCSTHKDLTYTLLRYTGRGEAEGSAYSRLLGGSRFIGSFRGPPNKLPALPETL